MAYNDRESKQHKDSSKAKSHPALQSSEKKESWRGTSDPSKVDKYVDCDEPDGWC